MTHITSQARPRPVHTPTDHPGFATARAWWQRHRPSLREALDATADEPPLLPSDDFADELDGPRLGSSGPVKPRRHTLPCELALILTLARALEAAGGQRPGAPATLSVIHGWGGAVMDQTETLLCNSEITDAFLQPSRDQPHIFTLAPGGASERMQAERRKTLAENISYGRPGASRSEIIAAAKQANAHDFIMGLPKAYETLVGERGVKLSGGERQRVAIARALAPSPRILVADEPTGNLDQETGRQIADLIFAKARERGTTLVLVTHDPVLAGRCDRQIAMRSGRIENRETEAAE